VNPTYDEVQRIANQSYECFAHPSDSVSLQQVKVDAWFRIFFKLKASLTVSFAAVQRRVLSSCLEGGGEAFQKKIGESFYSITVTGPRPSAGDGQEEMSDDEWAHSVVEYISTQQHWRNETTCDWYAFAGNTASEDGDDTLQVQVGRDL